MPKLELFISPTCPYCLKVVSYLKDNKIDIPLVDRNANSANRDRLVALGGKTQVPCLIIDDKPMYESDDIIHWFEENWKS